MAKLREAGHGYRIQIFVENNQCDGNMVTKPCLASSLITRSKDVTVDVEELDGIVEPILMYWID